METRTKLVTLELIGGIFGWIWIIASLAALYFFAVALMFSGRWSLFFWSFGTGALCKWLARGFNDSKNRVAYEAELISQGFSKEEAGRAWIEAYSGGSDKLAELERVRK
jgi:hypothetical protein